LKFCCWELLVELSTLLGAKSNWVGHKLWCRVCTKFRRKLHCDNPED